MKDSWPRFWYSPGTVQVELSTEYSLRILHIMHNTSPQPECASKTLQLAKCFCPKASRGEGEAGACVMMYSSMGSAVGENVFILGVYLLWLRDCLLRCTQAESLSSQVLGVPDKPLCLLIFSSTSLFIIAFLPPHKRKSLLLPILSLAVGLPHPPEYKNLGQ